MDRYQLKAFWKKMMLFYRRVCKRIWMVAQSKFLFPKGHLSGIPQNHIYRLHINNGLVIHWNLGNVFFNKLERQIFRGEGKNVKWLEYIGLGKLIWSICSFQQCFGHMSQNNWQAFLVNSVLSLHFSKSIGLITECMRLSQRCLSRCATVVKKCLVHVQHLFLNIFVSRNPIAEMADFPLHNYIIRIKSLANISFV